MVMTSRGSPGRADDHAASFLNTQVCELRAVLGLPSWGVLEHGPNGLIEYQVQRFDHERYVRVDCPRDIHPLMMR